MSRPPVRVSELGLAINEPVNCLVQLASGVHPTIHYNEVDDPDDTTFALLGMGTAGLRLFDVRDPANPTEVAYFNSGLISTDDGPAVLDSVFSHVAYNASTGHIWLPTRSGGFWVLELGPQGRAVLDLPPADAQYPNGQRARPAELVSIAAVPPVRVTSDDVFSYCSI